jgi:hypothetical protein
MFSRDCLNTLIEQFIGRFKSIEDLVVSAVYNPLAPLAHTRKGQVSKLRLIVDKRLTDAYFERLANTCVNKGLTSFCLKNALQDSQTFESMPLAILASEKTL